MAKHTPADALRCKANVHEALSLVESVQTAPFGAASKLILPIRESCSADVLLVSPDDTPSLRLLGVVFHKTSYGSNDTTRRPSNLSRSPHAFVIMPLR